MFKRTMTPGLAGGAALLLVLSLSGVVAGANLVGDVAPTAARPANPTFEDTDGNGVDDDCQEAVVADPEAEAAAETAVDTDGDGVISVAEAAHSDRVGGKNCNHGGYVSTVAHGDDAPAEEPAEEANAEDPTDCAAPAEPDAGVTGPDLSEPDATDPETVVLLANAHGKAVSEVAKSDAVGGKNCNHGGAVSEAAHADKAARDAAKAEAKEARAAARAEAKAARDAAKAERKAARDAAKAAKAHGK